MTLKASQVLALALDAGFSRDHANVMVAVSWYESGWDPNNIGDQTLAQYGSRGLWQIFTGAHSPNELKISNSSVWTPALVAALSDPATNARAAHIVFLEQGFQAWSTWNSYHASANFQALVAKVAALPTPGAPAPAPAPVPAVSGADAAAEAQVGHPDAVWTDECLKFVRTMFGLEPNGREGTAIAAWDDCPPVNRHPAPCNPPANVPVFWSGGSQGFGHVAVSIGNGHIISTDISGPGTVSIVPLTEIHAKWGLTFLGWTGHLEGRDIWHGEAH